MSTEETDEYQFEAYFKEGNKTYPVISLGVGLENKKHVLLDIYHSEQGTFEVNDDEVNIIQKRKDIETNDDFLKQLGQTVLQVDWVKIGERLERDRNYDGGGWEFLAKYWRDNKAFSVYRYFFHRFNKNYHWLDFMDGEGISMLDEQSLNILEYMEKLSNNAGTSKYFTELNLLAGHLHDGEIEKAKQQMTLMLSKMWENNHLEYESYKEIIKTLKDGRETKIHTQAEKEKR